MTWTTEIENSLTKRGRKTALSPARNTPELPSECAAHAWARSSSGLVDSISSFPPASERKKRSDQIFVWLRLRWSDLCLIASALFCSWKRIHYWICPSFVSKFVCIALWSLGCKIVRIHCTGLILPSPIHTKQRLCQDFAWGFLRSLVNFDGFNLQQLRAYHWCHRPCKITLHVVRFCTDSKAKIWCPSLSDETDLCIQGLWQNEDRRQKPVCIKKAHRTTVIVHPGCLAYFVWENCCDVSSIFFTSSTEELSSYVQNLV